MDTYIVTFDGIEETLEQMLCYSKLKQRFKDKRMVLLEMPYENMFTVLMINGVVRVRKYNFHNVQVIF